MSFREYVTTRKVGDNPAGDFITDARADSNFPDAQTWPDLKEYLARKGASSEAVRSGQIVWKSYMNMQRKTEAK